MRPPTVPRDQLAPWTEAVGPTAVVSQTWGACGLTTAESKLVRAFAAGHVPMAQHKSQWESLALFVGSDWRSFTDWAIAQSLANPYKYCQNTAGNTVNYVGLIQLKDSKGKVVGTYYPRIPADRRDYRMLIGDKRGN